MPMPAQPPMPDSTPMYCLPLYSQVLTLPMMPDGVLNFHSSLPFVVDRLQVAFERAVEDDVAGGRQRAAPDREFLGLGPDDLAGAGIPGDEVAHAAMAVRRRIHRQGRADVRLAGRVLDLERLVVHAHMVGRHVEQAGLAARRSPAAGPWCPAPPGRCPCVLTSGPFLSVLYLATTIGRPVFMSTWVAQFTTGSYFSRHQQLAGDAVERVAEAVAVEVHQRLALACRLTLMSARIISLTPS